MQTTLKVQLSAFMFLQYFIWGSWYVTMGSYLATLNFDGVEIGLAYGAFAIGAMISPFFVGLVADRFFASEKILGMLGLFGGLLMFILPQAKEFSTFYPLLILYCATYVPTLALGNSLSLHQLKDAKTAYPQVKIFSAIGWIAGGVTISIIGGEKNEMMFYLAGTLSVVFGIYSFFLPHTPPKKVGANVPISEILGLDALALLAKPSFAIFIVCMFLVCIPLYFYFVNMGAYLGELNWPNFAARMTFAQVSDVIFLCILPFMLRYFGYKRTIVVGIMAWAARYFILDRSVGSTGDMQTAMIFAAILLHGVCYDFLFIAGQLYVDDEANERNRGAAQGFIAFILWGVGGFVGTFVAGKVMAANAFTQVDGTVTHNWQGIWIVPAIMSSVVLLIFLIFFREPKKITST